MSENNNGDITLSPFPSLNEYASHYKTIKVCESSKYTHVVLMPTRNKTVYLTLDTLKELHDILMKSNFDPNCPVLIINGVNGTFCSGIDPEILLRSGKKMAGEITLAVKELIESFYTFKKPLLGVIHGFAIGLGMTILNYFDMTIASTSSIFCMPYTLLGYMPEGGATYIFPENVGATVATDLFLRGKMLTAEQAHNLGIISLVCDADLLPYKLVEEIKKLAQNPPNWFEESKMLMRMRGYHNLQFALENEVTLLPKMWSSRSCKKALKSAMESEMFKHSNNDE